jgi:hypothetical protein
VYVRAKKVIVKERKEMMDNHIVTFFARQAPPEMKTESILLLFRYEDI